MEENKYYKEFMSVEAWILLGTILLGIGIIAFGNPTLVILKIVLGALGTIGLVTSFNIARSVVEMIKEKKNNKLNVNLNTNENNIEQSKDKEYSKTYEVRMVEEKTKKTDVNNDPVLAEAVGELYKYLDSHDAIPTMTLTQLKRINKAQSEKPKQMVLVNPCKNNNEDR